MPLLSALRHASAAPASNASSTLRRSFPRLLVPGLPQWDWGRRDRGFALATLFASSAATAAFAWGTRLGWLLAAVCFATHAGSVCDALCQSAFPPLRRREAWFVACLGLGLGLYAPAMVVAITYAWPDSNASRAVGDPSGYFVNLWAFRDKAPQTGDWVWLRDGSARPRGARAGRVVAGPGEQVTWRDNAFQVDGRRVPLDARAKRILPPAELELLVPQGFLLVDPDRDGDSASLGGIELVAMKDVGGRAWARAYPLSERRLLN